MIATLNVLGLNYATLGNHEFDLQEMSLRRRLNESQFEWIASNVYEYNSQAYREKGEKIIVINTF
jgi:5'-nucleotidase